MTQQKLLRLTIRLIQGRLQRPLQLYLLPSMSMPRWMQMQPRKPLLHNMFYLQLPQ
jgi:hypothetical protein